MVFVAWIAYSKVKSWLRNRELKRWGDENGCGELPKVPNELPFGVERAWKIMTGMKGMVSRIIIVKPDRSCMDTDHIRPRLLGGHNSYSLQYYGLLHIRRKGNFRRDDDDG